MKAKLSIEEKTKFDECLNLEQLKTFLKSFDLNKVDEFGNTILHYYLKSLHQKSNISQYEKKQKYKLNPKPIIEEMIKNGIDINLQSEKGRNRHTPLSLTIDLYKGKEIFDVLIENGVDINKTTAHKTSVLLNAVGRYNFNTENNGYIIKRLIELGADIHLENEYGISAYSFVMEQDNNAELLKFFNE